MDKKDRLRELVDRFNKNLDFYKDKKNKYNEDSCRSEYIDKLLELLGWDVSNTQGLAPQFREVISEQFSNKIDRPDYTLTLRGVSKIFVEAKKPSVDITKDSIPALQARKYGWNAKHKISILTNFEYLIIYDTTSVPSDTDSCLVGLYKKYHYTDYVGCFKEIYKLISRESVYNGDFDDFFDSTFSGDGHIAVSVDKYFLNQINDWRVALSNDLYSKAATDSPYKKLSILNDVVQEFINQIVFLRICEDKNLPLYHSLQENIKDKSKLHAELEKMFREADKRYNSGMFLGKYIIFDLDNKVIENIIEGLYYPQSPFLFNIIEPNLLGQMYEMFLTEELSINGSEIVLASKNDCKNRSVVTTPVEIVKYMVSKTIERLCKDKTPQEIKKLKIADIACGSGVYLEEVFEQLQNYCLNWYLKNDTSKIEQIIGDKYKLTLEEKKDILVSCIYGLDIDVHAVEVAKFSLLIKLIENETTPSVASSIKILPDLDNNILFGNALVDSQKIAGVKISSSELIALAPFNWDKYGVTDGFDAIVGNPPYVSTSDMINLLPKSEVEDIYKKQYFTSFKQFDKYFLFIERSLELLKDNGFLCYIVPNKFFKNIAGRELRRLIAENGYLVRIDDFGDTQLFEDKVTYSSIILLNKKVNKKFIYSSVDSVVSLWTGASQNIVLSSDKINESPWRLTTDIDFMRFWDRVEKRGVRITKYANIFNGIQTSAERPKPIYWFSDNEVVNETRDYYEIVRDNQTYKIEKSITRPYFKPVKKSEKSLNSYSILQTNKHIIFPYDDKGNLIPINEMTNTYSGTWAYLLSYYNLLVPKAIDPNGTRDVIQPAADSWYKYGRSQGLSAFSGTEKLIVGILSKEPMYVYDNQNMLIASGGTAGYCAVSKKESSPYALEYLQAWLTHPYTEKIIKIIGSDFENGFVSRGTSVLKQLPFIELDLNDTKQNDLYNDIVSKTREIYQINKSLTKSVSKAAKIAYETRKKTLRQEIENKISVIYELRF